MRRVLHVPAEDLLVNDLVVFTGEGISGKYCETKVEKFQRDGRDGEVYLRFENNTYNQYCSASKQFELLQEIV